MNIIPEDLTVPQRYKEAGRQRDFMQGVEYTVCNSIKIADAEIDQIHKCHKALWNKVSFAKYLNALIELKRSMK
jgi:hypothetical protein